MARLDALSASVAALEQPMKPPVFEPVHVVTLAAEYRARRLEQEKRLVGVHQAEAQSLCWQLGFWSLERRDGRWRVFKTVYAERGGIIGDTEIVDFEREG